MAAGHSRATRPRRTIGYVAMVSVLAIVGALVGAPAAEARITRVEINANQSESPTFGGYSWPGVGQYEKIVGKAHGEVDPSIRRTRSSWTSSWRRGIRAAWSSTRSTSTS